MANSVGDGSSADVDSELEADEEDLAPETDDLTDEEVNALKAMREAGGPVDDAEAN